MTSSQGVWPDNVRSFDWTKPAMSAPPAKRTNIGYRRWCETEEDVVVDYYVNPDGSAEAVRFGEEASLTRYEPGTWEVEYPSTSFGSRGGCFIREKVKQ